MNPDTKISRRRIEKRILALEHLEMWDEAETLKNQLKLEKRDKNLNKSYKKGE